MPRRSLDVLAEHLRPAGRRVLDVGCGTGWLVRWLAGQGAHAVGVDAFEAPLERARAHEPVADERFVQARAEALPLDDGEFDAAVFMHSLDHVPAARLDGALAEALRVVRPGGVLYVEEPVAGGPHFELCRPVDDETEVRAEALAAIGRAAGRPEVAGHRTLHFEVAVRYDDFAAFRDRIVLADTTRASAFDALEGDLRAAFARLGEARDGATEFLQPMRVDVLTATER